MFNKASIQELYDVMMFATLYVRTAAVSLNILKRNWLQYDKL